MSEPQTAATENSSQVEASQETGQEQTAHGQQPQQQDSEEGLSTTEVILKRQAERRAQGEDDGEQKPAEEGQQKPDAEGEAKEEEGGEVDGAPESYEDFTTPEDGVGLGDSTIAGIKDVAKELNLSQEKAQKVVDAVAVGHRRQMDELRAGWQQAAKTDDEIGGAKHQEALAMAKAAMQKFGSEAFNALLADPSVGIGDMPEVIRFMSRVGKAISDDKVHTGAPTQVSNKNTRSADAAVLFDKTLAD